MKIILEFCEGLRVVLSGGENAAEAPGRVAPGVGIEAGMQAVPVGVTCSFKSCIHSWGEVGECDSLRALVVTPTRDWRGHLVGQHKTGEGQTETDCRHTITRSPRRLILLLYNSQGRAFYKVSLPQYPIIIMRPD